MLVVVCAHAHTGTITFMFDSAHLLHVHTHFVRVRQCKHACVRTGRDYAHVCVRVCVCIHTYMHAYIDTYIDTHIYTYIHI